MVTNIPLKLCQNKSLLNLADIAVIFKHYVFISFEWYNGGKVIFKSDSKRGVIQFFEIILAGAQRGIKYTEILKHTKY